jgi:hypothetical protein
MIALLALSLAQPPAFKVENLCPAAPKFTVTNLCPAAAKVEPVRSLRGYPLRNTWWTHPGEIHSHLLTGEHRNKWPADWLRSLTTAEAEALHADDHEGKVNWRFIYERDLPVKETFKSDVNPPVNLTLPSSSYQSCPGGNCPQSTTSAPFRLIRRW